jgi:hypothetical protein
MRIDGVAGFFNPENVNDASQREHGPGSNNEVIVAEERKDLIGGISSFNLIEWL